VTGRGEFSDGPSSGRRTLVLGLGNPLLCDDGVAIYVIREVRTRLNAGPELHFEESSEAGLALMDLLIGYDTVFILDALPVKSGPYGQLLEIPASRWEDMPLASSPHYTGLPSLLQMGQRLGYPMPARVRLFGITVKDPFTVREGLTPEVEQALTHLVDRLTEILQEHLSG